MKTCVPRLRSVKVDPGKKRSSTEGRLRALRMGLLLIKVMTALRSLSKSACKRRLPRRTGTGGCTINQSNLPFNQMLGDLLLTIIPL